MIGRLGTVLLGAVAGMFLATSAAAMCAPNTNDKLKCDNAMNKSLSKFIGSKQKCVTKCQANARTGKEPADDCIPPYGGPTLTCIADPLKGAQAKAVAAIIKGCAKGCPNCYSGGDCATEANARVSGTEVQVDIFVPNVYCDDSASPDGLTKEEAKCQDTVAKTLAKFAGSKSKCYAKCIGTQFKNGELQCQPPGCLPPATDQVAVACITKAETKAVETVDKACGPNNPECYDGTPLRPDSGAGWVALGEAGVDGGIVVTYCGSPSAAFLH